MVRMRDLSLRKDGKETGETLTCFNTASFQLPGGNAEDLQRVFKATFGMKLPKFDAQVGYSVDSRSDDAENCGDSVCLRGKKGGGVGSQWDRASYTSSKSYEYMSTTRKVTGSNLSSAFSTMAGAG
jgi:hypothetical protein